MNITVNNPAVELVLNTGDLEITATNQVVQLACTIPTVTINTCIPGPVGPAGPVGPSSDSGFELATNSDIGGNRAVTLDSEYAAYADHTDLTKSAVGISMGAVVAGTAVVIQSGGKMTVTGAGWTVDGLIYVGVNGTLTQTPPTTGFLQVIGKAYKSDVIIIEVCW